MFGFVQITEEDKAELRKLGLITIIITVLIVVALCFFVLSH